MSLPAVVDPAEDRAPSTSRELRLLEPSWYLRPGDVAALLRIAPTIVYEAIYRGELPASKFRGKSWLIARADAEAWVKTNSVPNRTTRI